MKTGLLNLIYAVGFSLLLISCSAGEEKPLVDPSQQVDSLAALELAPAAPSNPAPPSMPVNPEPPAAVQAPVAAPSAGLSINPEHGQPGHRCDVAVGAPLPNSAANTVVPSSSATTNSIFNRKAAASAQPRLVTPSANPSQVKLNPKHGEPGHRCDIQVGAPLN